MASDIQTYLKELQAVLTAAGADAALVQDALFDAEEHLQAEMAVGGVVGRGTATYEARFAAAVEGYGSPEEVAAAYVGTAPAHEVVAAYETVLANGGAAIPGVEAPIPVEEAPGDETGPASLDEAAPAPEISETQAATTEAAATETTATEATTTEPATAEAATPSTAAPAPVPRFCVTCGQELRAGAVFCTSCGTPVPTARKTAPAPHATQVRQVPTTAATAVAPGAPEAPAGPTPPAGVQAGMAAAAAGPGAPPSALRQIFGVFADPAVYKALVYMILSLGTGIAYFTIVVTGVSTFVPLLIMIIGIPLFLLFLGAVRGIALFEGRLVEWLLGVRMPRRPRAEPPNAGIMERIGFWLKDGRTWASMVYLVLMLPLGIAYFTIAITGLAVGIGLLASPIWAWTGWVGTHTFIIEGVTYHLHVPPWSIPLTMIGGAIVLVGTMHAIKWIGRGHAVFAKAMLVRLGK